MKTKRTRIAALLMALVFIFAACSSNNTPQTSTTTSTSPSASTSTQTSTSPSPSTSPSVTPAKEARLRISDGYGVTTFNPHTTEAAVEYRQNLWLSTRLYDRIYDKDLQSWKWAPEMAIGDPIDVNGDGSVIVVNIVPGRTFEDGTPINAETFEYSFKMLCDPKLANRNVGPKSCVNVNDYYLGEVESWDDVGIKATGEYELTFTIAEEYQPMLIPDFKETLAFVGYSIVHPATYEACFNEDRTLNTYGTSADKFVASGAYRVAEFIDGQYARYEKWIGGSPFAETVYTPDVVECFVVRDENTQEQMFQDGELDSLVANTAKWDDYPDVFYNYTPDNFGIFINSESKKNPVLQDKNFRYAIYWGFDRAGCLAKSFPLNRVNPYHYSALSTISDPLDDTKKQNMRELPESKAIRMDGHELTDSGYDSDLALEYFEKAYTANGSKKINIEMQYSEGTESVKNWAEAVQYHFNQLFGADRFEMTLRAVPHASIYENQKRSGTLDFDMTCTGGIYQNILKPWANSNWVYTGPDVYSTQYTLLGKEASEEWDRLYYACEIGEYKLDYQKLIEASARMEEILLNECTFVPAYARGTRYLIADHIEVLMDTNVGDPFLGFALMQAIYN